MKQVIFFLTVILASFTANAQSNESVVSDVNTFVKSEITASTVADLSNKRNHTYFAAQKEATQLNYKKSLDLTSIKSFRKVTQIRSKDTRRC